MRAHEFIKEQEQEQVDEFVQALAPFLARGLSAVGQGVKTAATSLGQAAGKIATNIGQGVKTAATNLGQSAVQGVQQLGTDALQKLGTTAAQAGIGALAGGPKTGATGTTGSSGSVPVPGKGTHLVVNGQLYTIPANQEQGLSGAFTQIAQKLGLTK